MPTLPGLVSQALAERGWVCLVLFGGRCVISALAASTSVQGLVWAVHVWTGRAPQTAGSTPSVYHVPSKLGWTWPMGTAPWVTCPPQRQGVALLPQPRSSTPLTQVPMVTGIGENLAFLTPHLADTKDLLPPLQHHMVINESWYHFLSACTFLSLAKFFSYT